jgi:uncharacterized RDD family membrane protein YckC
MTTADGVGRDHAAATAHAQVLARRVHGAEPATPRATPYVGLVTRVIAFALDAAIINTVAFLVGAVIALVMSLLPDSRARDDTLVVLGGIAFALWAIGYFVAFWSGTGQTPGNRLMQIKVERLDGSLVRPRHALVRLVGILLSAPLLVGFLPILVNERRRGFHDWLAGTVVIGAADRR